MVPLALATALLAASPPAEGPSPLVPAEPDRVRTRDNGLPGRGTGLLISGGIVLAAGVGLARLGVFPPGRHGNGLVIGGALVAYPTGAGLLWGGAARRGNADAAMRRSDAETVAKLEKASWGLIALGAVAALGSGIAYWAWPRRPPTQDERDSATQFYRAENARLAVGHIIPTGAFVFTTGITLSAYSHQRLGGRLAKVRVQPQVGVNGGGVRVQF